MSHSSALLWTLLWWCGFRVIMYSLEIVHKLSPCFFVYLCFVSSLINVLLYTFLRPKLFTQSLISAVDQYTTSTVIWCFWWTYTYDRYTWLRKTFLCLPLRLWPMEIFPTPRDITFPLDQKWIWERWDLSKDTLKIKLFILPVPGLFSFDPDTDFVILTTFPWCLILDLVFPKIHPSH